MSLRRNFMVLSWSAVCALALTSLVRPTPGLVGIGDAAPLYFGPLPASELKFENDTGMTMLRLQAGQALADLRAQADIDR